MSEGDEPVIISCVNLKGGVGKTTLAVNLAAYFGRKKKKTLLIDLDPQTNATFHCMKVEDWQKHAAANGTVADLLGVREHTSADGAKKLPEDVLVKEVFKNVDLIPSHLDLFTIDLDMGGAAARETKLRRELKEFASGYDIVICDCPPNLTIPVALSTLVALNDIDKRQWLSFIDENQFPIDVRPRDASRDILGKLLRFLEQNPEARGRLTNSAQRERTSTAPELRRALDLLLKS